MKISFFIAGIAIGVACFFPQKESTYVKEFGDPEDPVVIYLHGGPGYNSFGFENSVAQSLADRGYRVIVFDQAGTGRSKEVETEYSFQAFNQQLLHLYKEMKVTNAVLLGHSFGGIQAVSFAEANPERVSKLILMSTPLSFQNVYRTIIKSCREVYQSRKEQDQLAYLELLESMDTASLEYSTYSLLHAMNCGLYSPNELTTEAAKIYQELRKKPEAHLLTENNPNAVIGYYKSEAFTTLDIQEKLRGMDCSVKVILGIEDGLFDESHIQQWMQAVGEENLRVISGAGHNVFIDQREAFLNEYIKFDGRK